MAGYRAIEGASRTLRSLLRDRMQETVPVTLLPPDVEPADFDGPRVNLYLFEVKRQAELNNQMSPGQGPPGAFGKPPRSLELFYLLTTVFSTETAIEADLSCQRMLGDALGVLNEWPIVTKRLLAVTANDRPKSSPILDVALLDEHESLKVTLHPAGLEDYTKIWTALPEGAFRRSVVLAVSVVQIQALVPPTSPRPVVTRRLIADLGGRPMLTSVFRSAILPTDPVAEPRVVLGDQITIRGHNLAGQRTLVRLGGLDPIAVEPDGTGERLQITLPDAAYPVTAEPPGPRPIPPEQRLRAGTLTVQVLLEQMREAIFGGRDDPGTPGTATARVFSDVAVLQLLPELASASPASITVAAAGAANAHLTLTGKRLFQPGAASIVLVGEHAFDGQRVVLDPTQEWLPPPDDRTAVVLRRLASALPPPPAGGRDRLSLAGDRRRGAECARSGRHLQARPVSAHRLRLAREAAVPPADLTGELARLRRLLGQAGERLHQAHIDDPLAAHRGLVISDAAFARIVDAAPAPPAPVPPPEPRWTPLAGLAQRLGLDAFATDLVLLLLAGEISPELGAAMAYVQDDAARPWPTLALAGRLFAAPPESVRRALLPDAPLLRLRVVAVDARTKTPIPAVVPIATEPPMGLEPAHLRVLLPAITRPLMCDAANPAEAILQARSLANRTSRALKASGTVDGLKFGRILRAGLPVAIRGAGRQHSGNYYVTRVTHTIRRGSYEQGFEAWRNAVGLTGAELFIDPLALAS